MAIAEPQRLFKVDQSIGLDLKKEIKESHRFNLLIAVSLFCAGSSLSCLTLTPAQHSVISVKIFTKSRCQIPLEECSQGRHRPVFAETIARRFTLGRNPPSLAKKGEGIDNKFLPPIDACLPQAGGRDRACPEPVEGVGVIRRQYYSETVNKNNPRSF
jgi:hypothetical protein